MTNSDCLVTGSFLTRPTRLAEWLDTLCEDMVVVTPSEPRPRLVSPLLAKLENELPESKLYENKMQEFKDGRKLFTRLGGLPLGLPPRQRRLAIRR